MTVDIHDALRRAEALLEVDRPADALKILSAVVGSAPDSVSLHCLIARCYSAMGDYAGMLRAATAAATCGPDNEWGHRLRATALRKLGRDREAVLAAAKAVELDPFHWYTHATLAESLLALPDRDDRRRAYQAAKTALAIAPETSNTHITMGRVLQSIGEHRAARACFERAVGLNPTDPAGHTNLASVDLERGRIVSAGRGLRDVAASNPGVAIHADNVNVAAGRWLMRFMDAVTLAAYLELGLATFAPQPVGGIVGLALIVVVLGVAAIQLIRMPTAMRTLVRGHVRRMDKVSGLAHSAFFVLATWSSVTAMGSRVDGTGSAADLGALFLALIMVARFRGRLARYWAPFALRRRYRRYVLGADASALSQPGERTPTPRPAPSTSR